MNKILIVEDETSLANALKEKLGKEGFEVATAKNGAEGLSVVRVFEPDLIVSDLLMPIMSGLAMIDELKKHPKTAGIPILVLTNLSDDESMINSLQGGSLDFLIKSDWSLEAIVEKIKNKLKDTHGK